MNAAAESLGAARPRSRRSPICSGSATTTRRWAMARPTSGRTTPRCRSSRCSKPLVAMPRRARHHGRALSAGQGRPGAGRALQRGGEVLHRLFGRHGAGSRPAHLARRHRPRAHHRRGPRQLLSRCPRCATRRRAAGSGRSRRASTACRPTAAIASRSRSIARRSSRAARPTAPTRPSSFPIARSATRASASPRARWRRTASPPSSWAAPRTSSNMSACRACCSPIFRSAMRPGRPNDPRVAGADARPCAARARERRRRRAPPCSRRCDGATIPTGSSTTATSSGSRRKRSRAPRRIRQGEGRGEGGARGDGIGSAGAMASLLETAPKYRDGLLHTQDLCSTLFSSIFVVTLDVAHDIRLRMLRSPTTQRGPPAPPSHPPWRLRRSEAAALMCPFAGAPTHRGSPQCRLRPLHPYNCRPLQSSG